MEQNRLSLQNPPGAVGALVCGIVSLVFFWVPIVPVVLGVVGLVLAGKAKKTALAAPSQYVQGGMRTGGFVCALIGTILGSIYLVYWIVAIAFITTHADEFKRAIEEGQGMSR